ncbi:hypothetical protein B0J14DRAFT_660983 [Halenospora varia]|nr:hypothetical protein B0J14DRAFT_660983 [Halenospora varia]
MHFTASPLGLMLPLLTLATSSPIADNVANTLLAQAPPEANARLVSVKYSGSGCPQGSVNTDSSRISFPTISAAIGPNVPQSGQRDNCLLVISISCDAGWKYTVKPGTSLTVGLNLKDGVTGSYFTQYYMAGAAGEPTTTVRYDFTGPRTDSVNVADPAPNKDYPSSRCGGGIMNVDRTVAVTKGSSSSPVGSLEVCGDAGRNANFIPLGALGWDRC